MLERWRRELNVCSSPTLSAPCSAVKDVVFKHVQEHDIGMEMILKVDIKLFKFHT